MDDKTECSCWIRHATTPEHRKQVSRQFETARRIGDRTGIMLAMAQLSPCPTEVK
jgi:hypothetical protein